MYSHRTLLDFASTLHPTNYIDLPDQIILRILHAHTRATHILSFGLPPWFSSAAFEHLERFFLYYLHPISGGHATGQLLSLQYPSGWGYDNTRHLRHHIQILLNHFEGDIISVLDWTTPPPELWSNVDLDQEYLDSFPGEVERNINIYEPEYHGHDTI